MRKVGSRARAQLDGPPWEPFSGFAECNRQVTGRLSPLQTPFKRWFSFELEERGSGASPIPGRWRPLEQTLSMAAGASFRTRQGGWWVGRTEKQTGKQWVDPNVGAVWSVMPNVYCVGEGGLGSFKWKRKRANIVPCGHPCTRPTCPHAISDKFWWSHINKTRGEWDFHAEYAVLGYYAEVKPTHSPTQKWEALWMSPLQALV